MGVMKAEYHKLANDHSLDIRKDDPPRSASFRKVNLESKL